LRHRKSASGLNQALIERKTRFGLTCDFVGVHEFVSKVLESDQALLVFRHGAFVRKRAEAKDLDGAR
jgi:hypothetical protein